MTGRPNLAREEVEKLRQTAPATGGPDASSAPEGMEASAAASAVSYPTDSDSASAASPDVAASPAAAASSPPSALSASPSPSSSTAVGSDAAASSSSDVFADVLGESAAFISSESRKGELEVLNQAMSEVELDGEKAGQSVAGMLGFFHGFLQALESLEVQHPSAYSAEIWRRAGQLRSSLSQLRLVRQGFDVSGARHNDAAKYDAFRVQFLRLRNSMGFGAFFPNTQQDGTSF